MGHLLAVLTVMLMELLMVKHLGHVLEMNWVCLTVMRMAMSLVQMLVVQTAMQRDLLKETHSDQLMEMSWVQLLELYLVHLKEKELESQKAMSSAYK